MEQEYLIIPDTSFMMKYNLTQQQAEEIFFQSIKDHPELINEYLRNVKGEITAYTPLLEATHQLEYKVFRSDPRLNGKKIKDMFMYEVAHYLLDHGADVNMVQSKGQGTGCTALHYLTEINSFDYDLAKKLLDKGGSLNVQNKPLKCTPMHYASINNKSNGYEALKLYLQYPYDIDIKNCGGWTCYDLALRAGSNIYYPEEVQKEMDAKRLEQGLEQVVSLYDATATDTGIAQKINPRTGQRYINPTYVNLSIEQKPDWISTLVKDKSYKQLNETYRISWDSIPEKLNEAIKSEWESLASKYQTKQFNDLLNFWIEDVFEREGCVEETGRNSFPVPPIYIGKSIKSKRK